ncbi:MAG: nucleotide pyrophosphohydrolase [Bacteroidetes bacterium]|nr:nucleotide pyrophosphohydrolase [Bacteroidota bacterium]MCH8525247.1 nucleotide pyrophosphohydrolase [Balneolales bacterium]
MSDIKKLTEKLIEFRDQRDWAQFHNPKDLAIALNIESGELLEAYLWKNAEDANVNKVKEELADVFAYAFLLADKYQFDVYDIVAEKVERNGKKYPIEKAKGTAKKYDEL